MNPTQSPSLAGDLRSLVTQHCFANCLLRSQVALVTAHPPGPQSPNWANSLSHCSGHSWETSGLCGEPEDRAAVSMGEVTAQTGVPGRTGPRELGGLQQSPFTVMTWGTELQGLLLFPFGCCCRQCFLLFLQCCVKKLHWFSAWLRPERLPTSGLWHLCMASFLH